MFLFRIKQALHVFLKTNKNVSHITGESGYLDILAWTRVYFASHNKYTAAHNWNIVSCDVKKLHIRK